MKKLVLSFLLVISASNIAIAQTIITIAGNGSAGYSGDGGPATAAQIYNPNGMAIDGSDNIYIADYVNHRIRKVTTAGVISTIAGTGSGSYTGDGGPATAASVNYPMGIAIDAAGIIFFADAGNCIVRKIDHSGIIHTVAGNGSVGSSGDGGAATSAELNFPTSVAIDGIGNIYIADFSNNKVRKVDTSGIITTFAGTGSAGYSGDGGAATAAEFNRPYSVTVHPGGDFFIADFDNHVIRKINASGIVSTFAGNGTAGYAGDGGPATTAELNLPEYTVFDNTGIAYIVDMNNHRIRKIDAAGIITTVAGTGTPGYSGDGGPAAAAQLDSPSAAVFNANGDMYVSEFENNRIRKISFTPDFIADSFKIYIDKYCSGPQIRVQPSHFATGLYVKTYFGDGNTDSAAVLGSAGCIINHSYSNGGSYSIKQVLYAGAAIVDSFRFSYNHTLCNSVCIKFYHDANSNCEKDSTDETLSHPVTLEVDSNGVAMDTLSVISGLYYTAYGSAGDIYSFKLLTAPGGFHATCPSTGVIYDTLGTAVYVKPSKYFALECITSTNFDLSVHGVMHGTTLGDQYGAIYVQNSYCMPENATVTLHYSAKYDDSPRDIYPSPASISGNTITWNLSSLSGTSPPVQIVYGVWHGSSILNVGDTVHSSFVVDPATGDADTSNNDDGSVDTVRAGYDPNEMSVKPAGCIASGVSPTQLQYTIHFENTGNDTAHNIYVMDTLSNNVDISTMRLVLSSHEMYISKLKDAAGHNILKFDFPKINLRDSSHHGECDGAVIFNINTKPGLANSTNIVNRAGIYFDVNPVVMTNTVTNTIGCPVINSVTAVTENNRIDIYPNPAYSELNIKIPEGAYQSYSITNSLGSVLSDGVLAKTITQLNIQALPAGLYFINLKGEEGNVVRKFVKW